MILHTDATFRSDMASMGLGLVLRDMHGNLKAVKQISAPRYPSPLGAEAVAVMEGLRLAKELGVKRLTVLSDSLSLIKSINGEIQCESGISTTLWDIKYTQKAFDKGDIQLCEALF